MSRPARPAPRPRRAPAPTAPGRGALRVVAGTLGGRRFDAPPGTGTRPTSDRVRQAIFNALDSLDAVRGASVLDPFAGSGALGIEALSRGAARATFAEADGAARTVLAGNLVALGLADRTSVVPGSAARAVGVGAPYGLVLLDPPYAFDEWTELLASLVPHLVEGAVVVVESDREVALAPGLVGLRSRTYGSTVVQFAALDGATA